MTDMLVNEVENRFQLSSMVAHRGPEFNEEGTKDVSAIGIVVGHQGGDPADQSEGRPCSEARAW